MSFTGPVQSATQKFNPLILAKYSFFSPAQLLRINRFYWKHFQVIKIRVWKLNIKTTTKLPKVPGRKTKILSPLITPVVNSITQASSRACGRQWRKQMTNKASLSSPPPQELSGLLLERGHYFLKSPFRRLRARPRKESPMKDNRNVALFHNRRPTSLGFCLN